MSIDNVDFRCERRRIEMGLFDGENCVDVVKLTRAEALALRASLDAAIAEQERAYRPRQAALL